MGGEQRRVMKREKRRWRRGRAEVEKGGRERGRRESGGRKAGHAFVLEKDNVSLLCVPVACWDVLPHG